MAAIILNITEPEHDHIFTGSPSVTFRGSASIPAEISGISLFYRWYSNQFSHPGPERYSMNEPALTAADQAFTTTLSPGTHSIAFAVSDVAGESKTDFESIQHGGVTGGAEGDEKCLIHVFKANILLPLNGTSVNHNSVILQAESSGQWAVSNDLEAGGPPYVINDKYHEINRLQYRWLFEPVGSPSGRPVLEFIPQPDEVEFQPKEDGEPETDPTRIEYTVSLPATAMGAYRITLLVEDIKAEKPDVHSQQITVSLT